MFSMIYALLIAAVMPVQASSITQNVRICGASSPYLRFGEQTPGLFGSSNNDLKDQFFRIQGHLNIEKDISDSTKSRDEAIVDFLAATQISGIQLCIRGNLEARQVKENIYYFMWPKLYQLLEPKDSLFNPSELPGIYKLSLGESKTPQKLVLVAAPDQQLGQRYYLSGLTAFLRQNLENVCPRLQQVVSETDALSFSIDRPVKATARDSKLTLRGTTKFQCDSSNNNDILELEFEIFIPSAANKSTPNVSTQNDPQQRQGLIKGHRLLRNEKFSYNLSS